jgi:N6-L-threonylcarbamoyladenine synthase
VAILQQKRNDPFCQKKNPLAILHFHQRITADSTGRRGIDPIKALDSHARSLARLIDKSLHSLPAASVPLASNQEQHITLKNGTVKRAPDFITVTRGPGMRSNLSCGLDTAKGLAVAWQVPLLAIHHMQAHALTPRLVDALNPESTPPSVQPGFPFLSLLVSGGHTLLLYSKSLTEHETLATTHDTAIGEALDKIGRLILPDTIQAEIKDIAYAKHLSAYAFPSASCHAEYQPPLSRGAECARSPNEFGWDISTPFAETRKLSFSFSGIATGVERLFTLRAAQPSFTESERQTFARAALTVSFNHLASRTVIALEKLRQVQPGHPINTLVVSGGVAASAFLRHVLRRFLDVRGFGRVRLRFPPAELCTDNAAMIAWCGMEMFEEGWRSELSCRAVRKWSMDSGGGVDGEDKGGILGLEGWYNVRGDGKAGEGTRPT